MSLALLEVCYSRTTSLGIATAILWLKVCYSQTLSIVCCSHPLSSFHSLLIPLSICGGGGEM